MRLLILAPLLLLSACGLGHKNSSGGAPAELVGTYDAQCTAVGGSASAGTLGTHRALHVDGGGTATFNDEIGTPRTYGMHLVGTSLYQGQRDTGGGATEEAIIDLPNNQLRLGRHSGSTSTPVVYGTAWTIVKTSNG